MLQTIQTGSHISIQGEFVRRYADGSVMVRVGPSYYVGKLINAVGMNDEQDTLRAISA